MKMVGDTLAESTATLIVIGQSEPQQALQGATKHVIGKPEGRSGLSQIPAVLPQELLDLLPLFGSQVNRHLDRIDDQNYFNRSIGLARDSIERVKREDFLRLVVVQQSKVLGSAAGYCLP